MSNISIGEHVSRVYELILYTISTYTIGIYVGIWLNNIVAFWTATIMAFVLLIPFFTTQQEIIKRICLFGIGSALGVTSGPLIKYANDISSDIVPIAVATTIGLFVTFTIVSKFVNEKNAQIMSMFLFGSLTSLIAI